jgi:flagellar basal-body rod protein FlgB
MLRFIEESEMEIPAIMQLASGAAKHAAARQAHAARNIANADTPGFRPLDITPFDPMNSTFQLRTTRVEHFREAASGGWEVVKDPGPLDPNGNGVTLENEILRATDAQRAHSRAITIYQASMDILRTSFARGR